MQILPLCYLHLVAASRSYTCAQDDLDTVQLALVVFFLPSTSTNTLLPFMVVIVHCKLHWWCFPRSTGAFTNVLTTEYAQIATCTVWWWWLLWWWVVLILLRVHMYICQASGMQICCTVCSYLLLPSKMAAAHKWLYSSYPSQWYASRDRSNSTVLCTYF